jgi:chemotaxis signal transduction protein
VERVERLEWNSQRSGPQGWLHTGDTRMPVYGVGDALDLQRKNESFGALVRLRQGWALGFDRVERFDLAATAAGIVDLPDLIRPQIRSHYRGVLQAGDEVVLCLDLDQMRPDRIRNTPVLANPPIRPKPDVLKAVPTGAFAPSLAAGKSQLLRFWKPEMSLSFGLSSRQVIEFATDPPASGVPGSHPALPGVILWRNQSVAVLDLGLAVGQKETSGNVRGLLIVQVNRELGLVAIPTGDTMPRLEDADHFRVSSEATGVPAEFVRGVFQDSLGYMVIPNLEAILNRLIN